MNKTESVHNPEIFPHAESALGPDFSAVDVLAFAAVMLNHRHKINRLQWQIS